MTPALFAAFNRLKRLSVQFGLYRSARYFYRIIVPSKNDLFRREKAFYANFVAPGDLCFDIGANVGAKSEAMLAIGARVISVEPQPELAAEIAVRCSPFRSRHRVVKTAIGSQPGILKLHLRKQHNFASLIQDWEGTPVGTIDVAVMTMDDLINQFGLPKFCKIDVEGYEREVLRGLSHRIPIITLEYHTDESGVALAKECVSILREREPIQIAFTAQDSPTFLSADWVAGDKFDDVFPSNVAHHTYGDMIIRTAS